jgi:hypothetical protein
LCFHNDSLASTQSVGALRRPAVDKHQPRFN